VNESGLGKYVAPTALGAAYALARMGLLLLFLPEQAALFDFNLLFLAGVLLGFTLRPVVKPIFWTRSVGTVVILLLLLGIGPTGKLLEGMVLGTPMDEVAQGLLLGEFGAALLVALVAPWLLPPAQRLLDWNRLGRRLRQGLLDRQRLLEMLWLGVAYVLLFLGTQALIQANWELSSWWTQLQNFLQLPPTSIEAKLVFLLLRGWLLLLVLLPVCLTLTRQPLELWIVLTSLLFVVAEFTPAFVYFQQVPPTLLFDQVSGGLIRQAIFAALIAWRWHLEPLSEEIPK